MLKNKMTIIVCLIISIFQIYSKAETLLDIAAKPEAELDSFDEKVLDAIFPWKISYNSVAFFIDRNAFNTHLIINLCQRFNFSKKNLGQ